MAHVVKFKTLRTCITDGEGLGYAVKALCILLIVTCVWKIVLLSDGHFDFGADAVALHELGWSIQ